MEKMEKTEFAKLSPDEQAEYLLANNLLTPRNAYNLGLSRGGMLAIDEIKRRV